jgi:hypothetical protein
VNAQGAVVEVIEVSLLRQRLVNYFVVAKCPWCRRGHVHGAGRPDEDPRDSEGERMSHCAAGGTYRLQWNGTEIAP